MQEDSFTNTANQPANWLRRIDSPKVTISGNVFQLCPSKSDSWPIFLGGVSAIFGIFLALLFRILASPHDPGSLAAFLFIMFIAFLASLLVIPYTLWPSRHICITVDSAAFRVSVDVGKKSNNASLGKFKNILVERTPIYRSYPIYRLYLVGSEGKIDLGLRSCSQNWIIRKAKPLIDFLGLPVEGLMDPSVMAFDRRAEIIMVIAFLFVIFSMSVADKYAVIYLGDASSSSFYFGRSFWTFFFAILIISSIIAARVKKNKAMTWVLSFIIALCGWALLCSLTIIFNSAFDNSPVQTVTATVSGKVGEKGRGSSEYRLQFIENMSIDRAKAISVDYPFFKSVAVGDHIILERHDGFFGIPWVSSYRRASASHSSN